MKNANILRNVVFIKKLVYSAMFLASALVLPFLTGQVPEIGNMLCPMHLPVLLCGFVCGTSYGAVVGILAPLLRFMIFHAPTLFLALPMSAELMAYGAFAGIFYRLMPKKAPFVYVSLFCSMLAGRTVWGVASLMLAGIRGTSFTFATFWAGAVANAVPGIIFQIVFVPMIFFALRRARLILNE